MKLDRDVNQDGGNKYAAINMRKLGPRQNWTPEVTQAVQALEKAGVIEWGRVGEPDEFFLVKLKDENADAALEAYAAKAGHKDQEYGAAVLELAKRAGPNSPFCKTPD